MSLKTERKSPIEATADSDAGIGDSKYLVDKNVDLAASYAHRFEGEASYTPEEGRKVRWKVDVRLMGMLWFNSTVAAIDKVTTGMLVFILSLECDFDESLGTAALYGMRQSCHLTGNQYSWVGSAFYVWDTCHPASQQLVQRLTFISSLAIYFGVSLQRRYYRNSLSRRPWLQHSSSGESC